MADMRCMLCGDVKPEDQWPRHPETAGWLLPPERGRRYCPKCDVLVSETNAAYELGRRLAEQRERMILELLTNQPTDREQETMATKPYPPAYTGGPAFPVQSGVCDHVEYGELFGMTLRDWFAGMALQGYLAGLNQRPTDSGRDAVAMACYGYADAMLKVRDYPVKQADLDRP